ncbi:MAG: TetR/AcrR family transcriptional regulator [Gammaproteobacteria bacterium]
MQSLRDCIMEKGYTKTTLADVANAAGMYPSHLLYYYRDKDDILEQYFQEVANRILERIDGFRDAEPEQQIDYLTDLFFSGKGVTKSEVGFMLECFGVAVNDKILRGEKSNMDKRIKEYLCTLFDKADLHIFDSNKDAAEIAYSMLIGLRTAIYFDGQLKLSDARRLFHKAMLNISGLERRD